jgi:hypothetical protein
MKQVPITQGYFALVDEEDFGRVSKFKWTADVRKNGVYVKRYMERNVDGKRVRSVLYLHHFVLGIQGGVLVDHVKGNPLDNRKKKLRVCTQAENARNAKIGRNNTHGYKGLVLRPSGRWGCQLMFKGKHVCVGTFDTKEEAARAYDTKAKELFGEFANLNFPE